ncbi:MAG: glutamate synthase subunit beta [Kofleriaceae bacterium]
MGKPTGFLEWPRHPAERRAVDERLRDFREVEPPVRGADATAELARQAGRCMACGVPFCMRGCPLGNPIPDFNHGVWRDDWAHAWARLDATNNFPELTGRLCPAPCEAACVLALDGAAVTIEHVERALADRAFAEDWIAPATPAPATGRHVAVVGSGPAGLACAQQLRRAGHQVTVYEAADRAGGLCRYGIPDFKLDRAVLDARLAQLTAEGVEFRFGVPVGADPSWTELRARHDAVVVAIGAARPRTLEVPGAELPGVVLALDFLEDQNRVVAGDRPAPRLGVAGQRVIILGGGDTGSDCLGTALRQGATSVAQLELMPAPPEVRTAGNPWPQWPLVFRTSSSQEEGGERGFSLRTTRLEGDDRVRALVARREDTGAEVRFEVDVVIQAMGFLGPDASALHDQLGVELDGRGNLVTTGGHATAAPGVFACGDARRGASLIVWAIAEGRQAAHDVDGFLRGRRSSLPTV